MPFDTSSTTERSDHADRNDRKTSRFTRRRNCFFEANKLEPNFSDLPILKKFLNERGKIVPAAKSGVCARHQREISRCIKQARQLGLLPYTDR